VNRSPEHSHFDVYLVSGGLSPNERSTLLHKLAPLYRLDPAEAAAFAEKGQRLCARRGLDQDAAMKTLLALQQLGAHVELDANRPAASAAPGTAEEDLAELDEFAELTPLAVDPEPAARQSVDMLRAALSSLDGVIELTEAPSGSAPQLDLAPSPAPARVAPPPPPPQLAIAAAPTPMVSSGVDSRFAPPPTGEVGVELLFEAPAPRAQPALLDGAPLPEVERCPEHDLPEACSACAEDERPIPGRLLQGRLRQKPAVRLGAGIALGLLVGYLASLPYANRAERRASLVRAEADLDRYKNAPEAQANAARLDGQADDLSSSGAIGTSAIWLLIGGGVVAGWYRAT